MPRRALAAIFGVPALLAAAWTVFAGKDLNWDLLHYHYYVAHALVEGRSLQDYFAARAESYLNPLGYLPFYAMVSAGWHSVLASIALAAFHSASIGLLYLLCWHLLPHRPALQRTALSVLGAALGAASAVFWATAGTSFLDPLLLVPMLGGVLLLVTARPQHAARSTLAAAVLFGSAAALKYSNVFFALAALVLVASIPGLAWRERARATAAYAAGGVFAVGVLAGPWLFRLARDFGNPFFPYLNALFGSAEAPAVMLASVRFAPQDFGEAASLPLRMSSPTSMTYAEISAPDLRFAALAVALMALGGVLLFRHVRRIAPPATPPGALRLLLFFLLCMAAWIATSANARYGMLVLLLVGPCFVLVVEKMLPLRYTYGVLALLLGAQVAACAMISPTRWFIAERWSQEWVAFEGPERARDRPALYLTLEAQAMTVAIPFFHGAASFMNLQGRRADAAAATRIASLAEGSGGAMRVLGRGLRPQPDGRPRADVVHSYDATLLRFGFRVDAADCFAVRWQPADGDRLSRWANALTAHPQSREPVMSLASCALLRAEREPREVEEERRISAIFDRAERECPRLFKGQTAVTERLGAEWARSYPGLEVRVETRVGHLVFAPWFKLTHVNLGALDQDFCLQQQ